VGLEANEGLPHECGIGYGMLNLEKDGAKMVAGRGDTKQAEAIA